MCISMYKTIIYCHIQYCTRRAIVSAQILSYYCCGPETRTITSYIYIFITFLLRSFCRFRSYAYISLPYILYNIQSYVHRSRQTRSQHDRPPPHGSINIIVYTRLNTIPHLLLSVVHVHKHKSITTADTKYLMRIL